MRVLCLIFISSATFEQLHGSEISEIEKNQARTKTQTKLNQPTAYHYLLSVYSKSKNPPIVDRKIEVWALRGSGRKQEIKFNGKLVTLSVKTGRWRFVWDVPKNHVVAWASDLDNNLTQQDAMLLLTRKEMIHQTKQLKGSYRPEEVKLNGNLVEKITFRYLADPLGNFTQPIHVYNAGSLDKIIKSPNAKYRNRVSWFEIKTGRKLGYKCGCKSPKYKLTVDYPEPQNFAPGMFTFTIPRNASLEIIDPSLGRPVHSKGLEKADLRE